MSFLLYRYSMTIFDFMLNPIEKHILDWIQYVSEVRPELKGFAICPFASKSKYKIIESNIENLDPIEGFDVIIFVVDSHHTLEEIQDWVEIYNTLYEKWEYFEDCASYGTYINGIKTNNGKYNLILAQPREKLRRFREILSKTEYYDFWEEEYLLEILRNDSDLMRLGIGTP